MSKIPTKEQLCLIGNTIAERTLDNDRDATLDKKAWRELADLNIWRIPVNTEYGGFGGNWRECIECIDIVAKTCQDAGFLITMLGHVGSIKLLADHGSAAQKDKWLPRLLAGEIAVTAMTEKSGGSDLSKMKVTASKTSKGFSLKGTKTHITNAPVATMGMIAGRFAGLNPKRDITLFFVDFDKKGLAIGETENNLGIRTSPTADIDLDDVLIDDINIIGEPGDGMSILYQIISFERALYGIIAAGLTDGMLSLTLGRAMSRQAFGKNLADYQYIQRRITDMKMSSVVCRSLTYQALALLEDNSLDASIACSVTKYYAGELFFRAAEDMVQIYGHVGFMSNLISKYLRDAVGMRIAGGTSDIQRVNIFNQLARQYTQR